MTTLKDNKVVLLFAVVIGIGGWVWLYTINWKIAVALTLIMWSNNLTNFLPKHD